MSDTANWAIERLRETAATLGRLPKRADFDPIEVSRIKGALGPWPRALEKAGLKDPSPSQKSHPHPRKRRLAADKTAAQEHRKGENDQ